jgi:Uma2 family endonuclease
VAVSERVNTADDLWKLSHEGKRYELDRGVLVEMSPTGDIHGIVALWIGHLIVGFVVAHDLGYVTAAETGFTLSTNPDIIRAPDVAFIAKSRQKPLTGRYYTIAPDSVVEVVSPGDTASQIRRKVNQFLLAGTRLIWVVYPDERLIDIYRPDSDTETVGIKDTLDGGDVLPGLTLSMREVFRPLLEQAG